MKAEIGKTYRHFKNHKEYKVLSIGFHTETMEEMVVYEGQYSDPEFGDDPVWIRPRKMFEESVVHDGEKVNRFELLT